MRSTRFRLLILFLLLAAATAWKAWILLEDAVPFNGDEAIVGLMARHILLEGERPVFFYGQAYMGSLDAYLVAAGFALFGAQIWVIRAVQAMLYLAVLATTVLIGKRFLGSWWAGIAAAAILAIPPVNMALYTTASLGGYGEALLIGNLALLSGLNWIRRFEAGSGVQSWWFALLFGGLVGLGLWANGLSLIYSAPMAIAVLVALIRKRVKATYAIRDLLMAVFGFAVGALPWWLYAFDRGFASLTAELLGGNVAVETGSWLVRTAQHLLNLVVLGGSAAFGFRPPWEIRWLALPLLPFALIFWLGVSFLFIQQIREPDLKLERWTLIGVLLAFAAGFLFTSFGVDPSGRYFLPVFWVFALCAGSVVTALRLPSAGKIAVLAVVIGFQGWGTIDCVRRNPPGLTTQFYAPTIYDHGAFPELIAFLDAKGETRGYSTYWVSYPLAFRSQEQLIFTPRLPYHPDLRYSVRDDRYAPYSDDVAAAEKVAYITARNVELDSFLRIGFANRGVQWKEQVIGDFRVFYALSDAVRPQDIGLGTSP